MSFEMPFIKIHHGHNIKRLREMLGMKQEAIAIGLDMTQQAVSKLEQKETIEDEVLEKVAKILDVPVDAIKKLNENATVSYINTFNNSDNAAYNFQYYNFNPIEKIVELYERMLKIEQDKNAMLEQLLKEKNK